MEGEQGNDMELEDLHDHVAPMVYLSPAHTFIPLTAKVH